MRILRLSEPTLTTAGNEYGRRCYSVRANKRWRTWGWFVGWRRGGGQVSPFLLVAFLYTFRANEIL